MKAKEFLLSKGIVDKRLSKLLKEYANLRIKESIVNANFKRIEEVTTKDSGGWKETIIIP